MTSSTCDQNAISPRGVWHNQPLSDSHGRRIDYLRLSVTDRCNLRCRYCMPAAGVTKRAHQEILSFEELYRIAAVATELGIQKIRITGGEPLVRKGLVAFLAQLSALPGLEELALTTNGTLLPGMAEDLRAAGVGALNISLDSLQSDCFRQITRRGELVEALAGIEAAERAGLPLKINAVIMRGVNDSEILDFIRLTQERALTVRFIEYMPVIKEPGWQALVMTGEQILAQIGRNHQIEELPAGLRAGPARMFRIKGAAGSFGLITPLSGHFCADCNRIRVAADGQASSCLFSDHRVDLRPALATGGWGALSADLRALIMAKPARHQLTTLDAPHIPFAMSNIGG